MDSAMKERAEYMLLVAEWEKRESARKSMIAAKKQAEAQAKSDKEQKQRQAEEKRRQTELAERKKKEHEDLMKQFSSDATEISIAESMDPGTAYIGKKVIFRTAIMGIQQDSNGYFLVTATTSVHSNIPLSVVYFNPSTSPNLKTGQMVRLEAVYKGKIYNRNVYIAQKIVVP